VKLSRILIIIIIMSKIMAYRGVLKARINKLYGGDVTCSKVKKLKSRQGATKRDVQLANWFINMQDCNNKRYGK